MKAHPYWRKSDKIHPELKQVREEAGTLTEAEQKRIADAKKAEEERQERKRRRWLLNHGIDPDAKPKTAYEQGTIGQQSKVNLTEGCKIGRRDAVEIETEDKLRILNPYVNMGRICRQSNVGKSGVLRGYNDAMKDIEKAMTKGKKPNTKAGKADYKKVRQTEEKNGWIDNVKISDD